MGAAACAPEFGSAAKVRSNDTVLQLGPGGINALATVAGSPGQVNLLLDVAGYYQ